VNEVEFDDKTVGTIGKDGKGEKLTGFKHKTSRSILT
jgi:hypothetical protein